MESCGMKHETCDLPNFPLKPPPSYMCSNILLNKRIRLYWYDHTSMFLLLIKKIVILINKLNKMLCTAA